MPETDTVGWRGWFQRIVVVADFAIFLGFGIAFMAVPEALLNPLDIELGSAAALAEIRAMYGGVQIALAIYVAGAFVGRVTRRQVFALSGLAFCGLALVRLLSLLSIGFHPLHVQLLGSELTGVVANALALWFGASRGEEARVDAETAE